jgi:tRNA-Thr(GGU) m(6)t(6)A37 methyltransferase TsaA
MQCDSIGVFHTDFSYKYDVARQGVFFQGHPGIITLKSGFDFEQALRDLDGFERIWLIFQFHQNQGWRPTAKPPIPPIDRDRVGLFASRSPYRPNAIGLSCVRLLKINGLHLFVDECDLLDDTPILDIKPYIPKVDSFPDAKAGWVDLQESVLWKIESTPLFQEQQDWILKQLSWNMASFAQVQLSSYPLDDTRKRVVKKNNEANEAILAYRTFRILFSYNEEKKEILLKSIDSSYTNEELTSEEDQYKDKAVHRCFRMLFYDKKCQKQNKSI